MSAAASAAWLRRSAARWLCLVVLVLGATGTAAGERELVDAGRRLYREGILSSGQVLSGIGAAGVRLSGTAAACMSCHRRSGYGSSEGSVTVRSITGPALFGQRMAPLAPGAEKMVEARPRHATPPVDASAEAAMARAQALRTARTAAFSGARPRPNYDEALLARAIREGVDVTGTTMNPAMPRFDLGEQDLQALVAYLKTLSAEISPGVTEDKLYFATVVQPGVDAATRNAMVEVLQAFIRDRNDGRRSEQRREQAGMVKNNRLYREWVLQVWELEGEPSTWGAQLAARYREQPVFAFISGLGPQDWTPIHEFCEAFEVPEIFPQTGLPATGSGGVYSVYLSRGLALEAGALARFLQESEAGGDVVQVYRDQGAGRVAAEAFRRSWSAGPRGRALQDVVLQGVPDRQFWSALVGQRPRTSVVLWLAGSDLESAAAMAPRREHDEVYLSFGLGGDRVAERWRSDRAPVRVVYPMDLPAMRAPRLEAVRHWMGKNGIALTHEVVQMNAYLAATVTGMAATHSLDTLSREYFIERVEHRLGTALETSLYPRMSLGPGQRFASKGSYVAEFAGTGAAAPRVVSDWIVP